jgi:hypothetical protein
MGGRCFTDWTQIFNMEISDIKGKELHFLRMALNWQQYQGCYTLEMLLTPTERQWSKEFIYSCEKKGFIRFEGDKIYVTEEAIRSINEKDKRESRLIEEYIVDDFEYAFLMFMDNRNEPVPILDFPPNFKYHSKIDGQPVPGTTNSFYDWMTDVEKYIDNPTIDGFILNHTGKTRYEKLKKEKALKAENERLDIEVKRQTIEGAKFSRNVAYASLGVAALTAFVPLFIWWADKDKTQKTETEIPQLKQILQAQQKTQETLQDLQKKIYSLDTSKKKVKIEK